MPAFCGKTGTFGIIIMNICGFVKRFVEYGEGGKGGFFFVLAYSGGGYSFDGILIWVFFCLTAGWGSFDAFGLEFASAYSGFIFSMTFEGDFLLLLLTAV